MQQHSTPRRRPQAARDRIDAIVLVLGAIAVLVVLACADTWPAQAARHALRTAVQG